MFATTTYHYADNLTVIRGRHMMKMGANILRAGHQRLLLRQQWPQRFHGLQRPLHRGQRHQSRPASRWARPTSSSACPTDIGRGLQNGTWGQRATIWGFYFQDDWHVTNNLTLNLGLRWEYHTPLVEVENRQANFGLFSGQLELAGQNGNSRALYAPYKKDFQPRLGFAYTPDILSKKMVVRGAYTISSFMEGTGTNLRLPLNPPLAAETTTLYNTPADTLSEDDAGPGALRLE